MSYKTISEVPDGEKYGIYLTTSFFIITNLAFRRYLKMYTSKEAVDCHNAQIDFLEADEKLKIDFAIMKYYMELKDNESKTS